MSILAFLAVMVTVGAWLGIRYAEASQKIETDLAAFLLSMPVEEWDEQ